jgi:xanthine/uracil/vitamin C permease (AzgA family)
MLLAAASGIGLNAYRTYRTRGTLDATWYVVAVMTLFIAGTLFFLVARHANKPEKEE